MNQVFTSRIYWANICLFVLLLPILIAGFPTEEPRLLRLGISALLFIIICILPAINATAILSKVSGKIFDRVEFASIASVLSLLLAPFVLSLENDFLHILSPELPILNTAASFLLFSIFFRSYKNGSEQETLPLRANEQNNFPFRASFITSLIILSGAVFGIVTAYYPLPDFDPYYWVAFFQDEFTKGLISSLTSYRPLFSSLTYIFNQSAGIDLYAYFKYILPFFALTPLIPAMLIARRFSDLISQMIIFLVPLANASYFLYSTLPIPQAIFNSLLISAIFFTLHSFFSQKRIYSFLAGTILFIGFFYHEMAVIPLFAWSIVWFFSEWKNIISFTQKNKLVMALILLLFLSNFSLFAPMIAFGADWIGKIIHLISTSQTNFSFPAQYINIDSNSVGWQDASGVLRYYAYYFGPAAILALLVVVFKLRDISRTVFKQKETLFLILSLLLFVLISDIFPRLFSIALLPERALGFVSLFLLSFVPILFLTSSSKALRWRRLIPLGILIALFINLGAALYINSLKVYLITPAELASAEWIKTHLPENRIIFSSNNRRLLKFHANSATADLPNREFYADQDHLEEYIRQYALEEAPIVDSVRQQLQKTADTLADLSNKDDLLSSDFLSYLQTGSEELTTIHSLVEKELASKYAQEKPDGNYYIYYSAPNAKNPYAKRPYMQSEKLETPATGFTFDRSPDRFMRVYSLPLDEVVIWKLIR